MYTSLCAKPSFRKWMKRNFTKIAMKDMAKNGADKGFHPLIRYTDTTALYKRYHEDIWEILNEEADSCGHRHVLEMVATFGGARDVSDHITFENLMVWYAAEKVAREFTDI